LLAPWDDDPPGSAPFVRKNLHRVLSGIVRDAPLRETPSVAMARDWHRAVYEGVSLPVPYYAGGIRDSDPAEPALVDYEVVVGRLRGAPAAEVPTELRRFEGAVREATAVLDRELPAGGPPETTESLDSVIALCAHAHGEWVRIHPFANGNGRTARLWANWCALRYGLPAFLRLIPRPEARAYALACQDSMRGYHRVMHYVLANMLDMYLQVEAHA
jgi:fido (protein-threonine AMPylation protein)